jgi:serine/threonine protein phosphatase PrpC
MCLALISVRGKSCGWFSLLHSVIFVGAAPHMSSAPLLLSMVLSHKLQKQGATPKEIERAMYLAALSHFCIYNPSESNKPGWPLRSGDPLHQSAMTKQSCTMHDFHRALRARDPLGWGFESSDDTLLHLIWQLLTWDPQQRMTASEALKHPYFSSLDTNTPSPDSAPGEHNALESQMLDPRMDFNVSDSVDEFTCPQCGRVFADWQSCHSHANARRHAKFCTYDTSSLPTCLNAHTMLPAHASSGYCDIQGRRRTIEDFHAIHLLPHQQFYGIFDGHLGNFAAKYAASFLYEELTSRLSNSATPLLDSQGHVVQQQDSVRNADHLKQWVEAKVVESFAAVHDSFIGAMASSRQRQSGTATVNPHYRFMDQSGTTATALLVTNVTADSSFNDYYYIIASVGDSRAVLSSRNSRHRPNHRLHSPYFVDGHIAVPLTSDHVASNRHERDAVHHRGGRVIRTNGMDRVNGTLIITRSIGDADLSPWLSRTPDVTIWSRREIRQACRGGTAPMDDGPLVEEGEEAVDVVPCFMILASDGLWDTVSNQEAVDLVAQVVSLAVLGEQSHNNSSGATSSSPSKDAPLPSRTWMNTAALQQAAEALTLEAYVRGSTDNIGVCIVAIE